MVHRKQRIRECGTRRRGIWIRDWDAPSAGTAPAGTAVAAAAAAVASCRGGAGRRWEAGATAGTATAENAHAAVGTPADCKEVREGSAGLHVGRNLMTAETRIHCFDSARNIAHC